MATPISTPAERDNRLISENYCIYGERILTMIHVDHLVGFLIWDLHIIQGYFKLINEIIYWKRGNKALERKNSGCRGGRGDSTLMRLSASRALWSGEDVPDAPDVDANPIAVAGLCPKTTSFALIAGSHTGSMTSTRTFCSNIFTGSKLAEQLAIVLRLCSSVIDILGQPKFTPFCAVGEWALLNDFPLGSIRHYSYVLEEVLVSRPNCWNSICSFWILNSSLEAPMACLYSFSSWVCCCVEIDGDAQELLL